MKEVINNNNEYKLKFWLSMLYMHGRKFMIGPVFTYQKLNKDFIFCLFIKIWAPILVHPRAVTDLKNALYYPLKCDQIHRKLWVWSHLLKKSLMENFIFCAVEYFVSF